MKKRARVVEWLPASASDLTRRRRRVSPADEAGIDLEELILGIGVVAMPVLIVTGTTALALGPRILVALGWFLANLALLVLIRHGLYLCRRGVTVQRGVWPRDPVPWSEVDEFRLVRRRLPLGGGEREVVALATVDGQELVSWALHREPEFERDRLPVEWAKAKLRSYPALVDQLNRIVAELHAAA